MLSVCGLGLPPPTVALKVKRSGETAIVGWVTTKVTGTFCGLLVAFGSETTMVSLYVPPVNPVIFTLTLTDPLTLPEVGFSVSQAANFDTVQFSVPWPELVMLNVCGLGLPPPTVPLNVKKSGDTAMVGFGGGATTKVTGTFCGLLVALGSVTTIVSL